MENNEIELMDYLNVLWKKKWLIILPTLFCVIAAGIISFLLPPQWEIDAIILPSKFSILIEQGMFEEIVFIDPKQIVEQINGATYNHLIATELKLDIRRFTKLRAENLPDTKLVRIFLREQNTEEGKSILYMLFNLLKKELDEKANIEIKEIESQIKSNEIEKLRIKEEITVFKKKLNIVKKRKKEIEEEMSSTKSRIELLENEQSVSLKKENRSETESLAMLLYSNEIQQSLRYQNTLSELLGSKNIEEENINLEIENAKKDINQLEITIDSLNEKKERIDNTQLIKEPTSSPYPVSPQKKLNVLIAGILGLMIFIIIAFFLEYIKKHKTKT